MLDTLNYTSVAGSKTDHEITVYALSTCGFCKRALAFLNTRDIAYRYIHMDMVPLETKNAAKKALKERFKADIAFPFAIIDGDKHLVGFIEPDWVKTLGLVVAAMAPKTFEQTMTFATMVAAKQGWTLNPDEEFTKTLVEGLQTNWNRYGYFLCPCRDSDGSREADSKVVCPCAPSWKDVEEFGHCFCALYLGKAFAASGRTPASIPDRRSQF